MPVRAIRGAVQAAADLPEEITAAAAELVTELMVRNGLTGEEMISVILSATGDLDAEFPALGARKAGLTDVPLMCVREMEVPGAMPRVIRVLVHVETSCARDEIQHVYLGATKALRPDLHHGPRT
ncbi:chorismate mutase [Actinomadura gamaensis]|uniref:chorismate mutase n=1 Tax=Actinomadura gamaensis TaxID=1763541 RepID=A0ABV9TWU0_9ACTN